VISGEVRREGSVRKLEAAIKSKTPNRFTKIKFRIAAVPRPTRSRDTEDLGVGKLTFVTSTVRAEGGSGVTIATDRFGLYVHGNDRVQGTSEEDGT
jgi:hypothetical protein